MAKPTITVEIAFDAGYTGTPTWTDVTEYVRHAAGISITRGRGSEGEVCSPNTLALTLANDDGRFTPGNTSSPYYPNVRKGRRIRVTATHNGTDYERFTGYINDWRVTWPGKVPGFSDCIISASSRMARLGNSTELRSIIEETALSTSPAAYFTMGEPEGALSASDSSGNSAPPLVPRGLGSAPVFGNATGPGTDDLTAVEFNAGQHLAQITGPRLVGALTVSAFTAFGPAAEERGLIKGPSLMGRASYEILINNTGTITATVAGSTATSPSSYADGNVHHVAITFDSLPSANLGLYVDGELVASDTDAGSAGLLALSTVESLGAGMVGSVSHLALFDYDLSSTAIENIAEAGLTGFAGETAADRLTRYAAFAGIDSAHTDFETGQVADLAHIDTTGKTALAVMREVETTEGGVLFDAPDGTLTFHDRAHRYSATSAFTLDYDNGDIANDLSPVLDDQQQVNDMTATNTRGVSAREVDHTSIDDHGPYRQSLDLATEDPDEPAIRAGWVVGRYAVPTERVSELEVDLSRLSTALNDSVLAADVGTRFTLSNLPDNAPASTMALFAEGFTETITADSHRIKVRTTPAELFDVWTVGDATLGAWDETPIAY